MFLGSGGLPDCLPHTLAASGVKWLPGGCLPASTCCSGNLCTTGRTDERTGVSMLRYEWVVEHWHLKICVPISQISCSMHILKYLKWFSCEQECTKDQSWKNRKSWKETFFFFLKCKYYLSSASNGWGLLTFQLSALLGRRFLAL